MKMLRHIGRFAIAWAVLVLVAVLIPSSSVPGPEVTGIDKLAHITLFYVLAILGMMACPAESTRCRWRVVAACLFYGAVTELLQGILPLNRSMEALDFVADAVGVMAAIPSVHWWRTRLAARVQT